MDDRVSHLPDDVLIRIISFLPVQEIARAKLVSKAWKNISESCYVPPLTFECPPRSSPKDLLPPHFHDPTYKGSTLADAVDLSLNLHYRKNPIYNGSSLLDAVDSALKLHYRKNLRLSGLRLRLDLHPLKSRRLINSWIDGALDRKVGQLDLCFLHNCNYDYYPLPEKVFSAGSITVLSLDDFKLKIGKNTNIDLPALRKLRLKDIRCDERAILKLISGCPSIRDLEIATCPELRRLRFSGRLDNLQRLSVVDCAALATIKIDVPSLLYLRHDQGPLPCVVLLSSSECLRELVLWSEHIVEDLFQNLVSAISNLERLEINGAQLQRIEISHHRLKRLEITLTEKQEKAIFKIDTPNLRSLKYNGYRMPFDSIISSHL